jgi:hypothetical protein
LGDPKFILLDANIYRNKFYFSFMARDAKFRPTTDEMFFCGFAPFVKVLIFLWSAPDLILFRFIGYKMLHFVTHLDAVLHFSSAVPPTHAKSLNFWPPLFFPKELNHAELGRCGARAPHWG